MHALATQQSHNTIVWGKNQHNVLLFISLYIIWSVSHQISMVIIILFYSILVISSLTNIYSYYCFPPLVDGWWWCLIDTLRNKSSLSSLIMVMDEHNIAIAKSYSDVDEWCSVIVVIIRRPYTVNIRWYWWELMVLFIIEWWNPHLNRS